MARKTNRRSKSGGTENANSGTGPYNPGTPKSRRLEAEELQRLETARAQRERHRPGAQLELGDLIAAAGSGGQDATATALAAELAGLEQHLSAAIDPRSPDPSMDEPTGPRVRDGLLHTRELVARAEELLGEARAQRQEWVRQAVRMRIPAIEIAQLCGVERNTAQVWQREIRAGKHTR